MNGPPRGPSQDNSRLYQPLDGPFNGSDSALMGDKLKEFQNREQIFGRDHAMQHFYYTNAD